MGQGHLIDSILLKKFQKISDWIQDHIGYNNFAVAKFLRVAMVIVLLSREVISCFRGIDGKEIIIVVTSVLIILKMKFIAYNAEQILKDKNGIMNPAANEYAGTRIIIQFVALAAFGYFVVHLYYILSQPFMIAENWFAEWKELFWYFFGVLILPVVYFSSCTPRPFNTRRARRFIENNKLSQSVAPLMAK